MNRVVKQKSILAQTGENFGKKIGLLATHFGCWHKDLSRPFTHGGQSYRVCLNCGARRNFNPQTLTTLRGFYYPPKPLQN